MSSDTRQHVVEVDLAAAPERVFDALVRPSAVRRWWGAARVVIVAREGGVWAAAWGDDEDRPEYVTTAVVRDYDPPRRLAFGDYDYQAGGQPLEFARAMTTTFEVLPTATGCRLRITQGGFPADRSADDFYAACEQGWHDTLGNLRRYLEGESA